MLKIPNAVRQDIKELGNARLFGSRAMAAKPKSESFDPALMIGAQIDCTTDWDFSAQYSDDAHNYLISARYTYFSAKELQGYADNLTEGVYIKEFKPKTTWSLDSIFSNADVYTVNVVLHSDEMLFRKTWDAIDAAFYYNYVWKRSAHYDHIDDMLERKQHIRQIMNQLYAVARQFT